MSRIVTNIVLFIFITTLVTGENLIKENYRHFLHYNTEQGLSSNMVRCFYRDSTGILWIGTTMGLNRFDGTNIEFCHSFDDKDNSLNYLTINSIVPFKNKLLLGSLSKGISVFDPVTRKHSPYINKEISTGSIGNVFDVKVAPNGLIWVASTRAGAFSINPVTDEIKFLDIPASHWPRRIFFKKDGSIWISTWNSDVFIYNPADNSISPLIFEPDIKIVPVERIVEDKFGNIFMATWGNGILKINKIVNNRIVSRECLNDTYKILSRHSNDMVLIDSIHLAIATTNGIYYFERQNKSNPDEFTFDLSLINKENPYPLKSVKIQSLYYDNEDILWIATKESGFHSLNYKENSIKNYNNFLHTNTDFILNHLFKLNNDEVAVCFDRQTYVLNFRNNTFIPFKQHPIALKLKNTFKTDFSTLQFIQIVTINGEKWIFLSKPYGDFYFIKSANDFSKSEAFVVNQNYSTRGLINSVQSDIYNNIWLGTEWGLRILKFRGTDKISRFPSYEILSHSYFFAPFSSGVSDILLDTNHNMWLALNNNTTMVFPAIDIDSIPQLLNYRIATHSIEKLIIKQIVQESDSLFLLATFDDGLIRYNFYTDDVEYLTRSTNFKSSMVNSVVVDNKGNYWMGTEKGICIVDPKKRKGENLFFLTKKSGLLDNYFVNKCALRLEDNTILMGNINNLTVIDSSVFAKESFVANPYISSIELYSRNDKNYKEDFNYYSFLNEENDGILVLPSRFYGFKISFSSLSLKNPSNNKFAYRLMGYNNKWTYVNSEDNSVFYQNIPEGTYTFQLKVSNSRIEWNDTPLSISIKIKPVFWKTNLFKIILILLFVFAGIYIYFRRNYLLEKRNRLLEKQIQLKIRELKSQNEKLEELLSKKNKFISILSHDLKNPLSASKGLIDIIISDISTLNESEVLHYLKSISESLEGTYSLLENLVMWGKKIITSNQQFTPQTFNLFDELEKNIQGFIPNAKNINIINETQKDIALIGDLNMFDAVVRNLISNALKYSYVNDKVLFTSTVHNRYAVIKITDYGKGIPPEKINDILNPNKVLSTLGTKGESGTGFGLMIVQDFISLMGGTISVESEEFKGTTFSFSLPLA